MVHDFFDYMPEEARAEIRTRLNDRVAVTFHEERDCEFSRLKEALNLDC